MKGIHCFILSVLLITVGGDVVKAQANMVQDQNPSFAVSRDKYIKFADSLNARHGTTLQETYKAIDYLEDKRAERKIRRAIRREYHQSGFNDWPYDYNYYSPFNRISFYRSYRPRYYSNNYMLTTLPLAYLLGRWSR